MDCSVAFDPQGDRTAGKRCEVAEAHCSLPGVLAFCEAEAEEGLVGLARMDEGVALWRIRDSRVLRSTEFAVI